MPPLWPRARNPRRTPRERCNERHGTEPLAAADGRHVGETTLPVCVTGRMVWQATVMLEVGRKNITVPFRFESGH